MAEKTPEQIALDWIDQAYKDKYEILDLSGLKLTTLPVEISKLSELKALKIDNNFLTFLPPEIGNLRNLSSLLASHNQISSIPNSIGKLSNLRRLDLAHNKIEELPVEIFDLVNMEFLYLQDNQLTIIPQEIQKLKALRILDLDENYLDSLPQQIGELFELETLVLSNNEFTRVPSPLKRLLKLQNLDIQNNRLSVPPEVLEKTNEPITILDYIDQVFLHDEMYELMRKYVFDTKLRRELNECKVVILGQGNVGKTSLVRRIMSNTFSENETKTEGVKINKWDVTATKPSIDESVEDFYSELGTKQKRRNPKKKANIQLNIWDFGGQEIMHATHQFFLTKRSLYLLVLDSRLTQEENRVEYWLKIIQSFGGESPVLIVGNKVDQHPLDIDRTGLQKKYPNIVGILETSAATGTGIEELKAAITEQVNNLPHVRDLLPETWFTVKTKLEGLGRESNFITHDRYLELCAENEVSDETSQRTLIGFLHDLGVVLHFQDDPRLEALGILNPQWVTNGVYKILNSHTLFQNKGVLTTSMLDEILNLPEYPRAKRLFIVDMMKKFELCYDIEPDKTFLVPDLLPKDEPATDGRENALAFQYHYTVLPSSVITRFIVRMNEFVHEKVWRSGVVLKDGGSTALVKADIEDRKVFIWVSGDEHKRHDFLSKIRGQFDAIHKTISKLEVKEMVPVPNHPESEPVDYDLLLQMDHNNVEVYPVLSGGKMIVINVRAMLNGVAREADRQRGNITNFYIGRDMNDSTIIAGNENKVNK
jgi:internalin A